MDKRREELIAELIKYFENNTSMPHITNITWDGLATFILERDKKNAEDLIKSFRNLIDKIDSNNFFVGQDCYVHVNFKVVEAARETLKNLGCK